MIHPLLLLIATKPQLLAEHAEAYAELMAAEIGDVSAAWKRRALLNAVALVALGVGTVLAGVALMLWAVTPAVNIQARWALMAAPLFPIVIALCCLLAARVRGHGRAFDNIRQQVKADLVMLREASVL